MNKHSLRLEGDELADGLFLYFKSNPSFYQEFNSLKTNEALLLFVEEHSGFHPLRRQLANMSLLNTASNSFFFEKHVQEILTVLGLYSLPYCYAGANGARVLVSSEKILSQPKTRLMETAQFVFDVCQKEAFCPENRGLLSIIKVRLLHAAIRFYSSRSIKDEVPINQEDMLGTYLSFSLLVIRGIRKLGVEVSEKEAHSYLNYWSKIVELMGVKMENLPKDIRAASSLERQIRKREFKRSEEGVKLTASLTNYLQSEAVHLPGVDPIDLMRFLLGAEVSDMLDLPASSNVKQEAVVIGLRTKNFFQKVNSELYVQLYKDFQRQLVAEKIKPNFQISFE
jgi:hypothetical protein